MLETRDGLVAVTRHCHPHSGHLVLETPRAGCARSPRGQAEGGVQGGVCAVLLGGGQQEVHLVIDSVGLGWIIVMVSSMVSSDPATSVMVSDAAPHQGEGKGGHDTDQNERYTTDNAQTDHLTIIHPRHALTLAHPLVLQLRHLASAHSDGLYGVDHPGLLAGRVHGQVQSCHAS